MSASPDVLVGSFAAENRSVSRGAAHPEALQKSHLELHRTDGISEVGLADIMLIESAQHPPSGFNPGGKLGLFKPR